MGEFTRTRIEVSACSHWLHSSCVGAVHSLYRPVNIELIAIRVLHRAL